MVSELWSSHGFEPRGALSQQGQLCVLFPAPGRGQAVTPPTGKVCTHQSLLTDHSGVVFYLLKPIPGEQSLTPANRGLGERSAAFVLLAPLSVIKWSKISTRSYIIIDAFTLE